MTEERKFAILFYRDLDPVPLENLELSEPMRIIPSCIILL
jgi:hypothetical protein